MCKSAERSPGKYRGMPLEAGKCSHPQFETSFLTHSCCRVKSRMPLNRALKVRIGHRDMNAPAKRTLSFAG